MAAPNLTITVEPTSGGTAYFLPLAASAAGVAPQFKLVLRLRIQNTGSSDVYLSGISFVFPGSTPADKDMQGIRLAMSYPSVPQGDPQLPKDGKVEAGESTTWSSGLVNLTPENDDPTTEALEGATWFRNEVYADLPAPASIIVRVNADDYSDPVEKELTLAPFPDPAFALPFRLEDLGDGEYVATSAEHSTNGGASGGQIYAHDIGIIRMTGDGAWTDLHNPGLPFNKENYLIWDRAVCSMAPGVVTDVVTGVEDDAGKVPLGGNSVTIDHSGLTAVYCHFKKDSTEVTVGQTVDAGTKLGTIGWSGNTSNPHLHIALTSTATGRLRGIAFADAQVLDLTQVDEDNSGPWAPMDGVGIPRKGVAIHPANTPPLVRHDPADVIDRLPELIGRIFGGVASDGGGFMIVGGKIVRVPPRGPIWELLQTLVAMEAVQSLRGDATRSSARELSSAVVELVERWERSIGQRELTRSAVD